MKRQKMLIGGIVKISLSGDGVALGKILKEGYLVVYKKQMNASDVGNIDLSVVENSGELLYGRLFNDVITKGIFEIIEQSTVTEDELKKIPPRFSMKTAHPELCNIMYGDGTDRKALPSECIGMDFQYIWEAPSFVELIEDRLAGRVNKYERLVQKELERGIAIEKERGMKVPWEGWQFK
jgi:hypothetical protein